MQRCGRCGGELTEYEDGYIYDSNRLKMRRCLKCGDIADWLVYKNRKGNEARKKAYERELQARN